MLAQPLKVKRKLQNTQMKSLAPSQRNFATPNQFIRSPTKISGLNDLPPLKQLSKNIEPLPNIQLEIVRSFNLLDITNPNQSKHENTKITSVKWLEKHKEQKCLSCIDSEGNLSLVNMLSGTLLAKEKIGANWLTCLDEEHHSKDLLAIGGIEGKVYIAQNKITKDKGVKTIETLVGHRGSVLSTKFLSKNYLISGSTDSLIGMWDVTNPHRYMSMIRGHSNDVACIDVSRLDSNIFLTGSSDLSAKIWDIRLKNPEVFSFLAGKSTITAVHFFPQSMQTFATSSNDSCLRLFDLRVGSGFHILADSAHFDPISDFEFSSSGRLIFAAVKGTAIKIWDTLSPSGDLLKEVDLEQEDNMVGLSMAENSGDIATSSTSGEIRVLTKSLSMIKMSESGQIGSSQSF